MADNLFLSITFSSVKGVKHLTCVFMCMDTLIIIPLLPSDFLVPICVSYSHV